MGQQGYTRETYLDKVSKIHNNFYDYTEFRYSGYKEKSIIICPKHGKFEQSPKNHVYGGCKKCGREVVATKVSLTPKQFLEKANELHNNKYTYPNYKEYKSNQIKLDILCKDHGVFKQRPGSHLQGEGCPECAKIIVGKKTREANLMSQEDFINKVESFGKENMDYSKSVYSGSHSKVRVRCKKHGYYETTAGNLMTGTDCQKCVWERQTREKYDTLETFTIKAKKVYGEQHDYTNTVYKGTKDKVTVRCKKHDIEFMRVPNDYLSQESGCPKCARSGSRGDRELAEFIKQTEKIRYSTRNVISPLELDVYIPSKKVAFEYDGLYYHTENKVGKKYHLNKTNLCRDKGIRLIHIFEDEWRNKKDIVKSRIDSILGRTATKIYARKTEIKEVTFNDTKNFLNDNHVQGHCVSKIRYGLFYKKELVSIITFGKKRKNLGATHKDGEYELIRFCNKINTTVVGGASKLLKYFENNYKPVKLISYADLRWSEGNLYCMLGFEKTSETRPGYYYMPRGCKYRENRYKYRKSELVKQGFDENKTEFEIMEERGFERIYDCGNIKFCKNYN